MLKYCLTAVLLAIVSSQTTYGQDAATKSSKPLGKKVISPLTTGKRENEAKSSSRILSSDPKDAKELKEIKVELVKRKDENAPKSDAQGKGPKHLGKVVLPKLTGRPNLETKTGPDVVDGDSYYTVAVEYEGPFTLEAGRKAFLMGVDQSIKENKTIKFPDGRFGNGGNIFTGSNYHTEWVPMYMRNFKNANCCVAYGIYCSSIDEYGFVVVRNRPDNKSLDVIVSDDGRQITMNDWQTFSFRIGAIRLADDDKGGLAFTHP